MNFKNFFAAVFYPCQKTLFITKHRYNNIRSLFFKKFRKAHTMRHLLERKLENLIHKRAIVGFFIVYSKINCFYGRIELKSSVCIPLIGSNYNNIITVRSQSICFDSKYPFHPGTPIKPRYAINYLHFLPPCSFL